MRNLLKILLLSLCTAYLFFGCSKDEQLSMDQIRYGERDTISLGFSFQNAEQQQAHVKAPVYVDDAVVNNVNVYVFNQQGDVITHRYATGGASLSGLVIYRNMQYRIYAIANAGESLPCRTVAEVESLSVSISHITQVADASGGVLMSGKTELMLLFDGQHVAVDMERCVSKFLLSCNYDQLNSGVTVTVKRVQLKNAPTQIQLFKVSKASGGAVIDGEVRTGSDLNGLSGAGAAFYLFENMQGMVASSALNNKSKEKQMSTSAKANSSYIEMEYDYLSAQKQGTIVYRFYLGRTFADCDVKRNTQYTCMVLFKGNGSADENSWSVDNSQLVDRVTDIVLNPTSHTFKGLGETLQIRATVIPATAQNSTVSWSSSNSSVATVNSSGLVTAIADGSCTITATSTDGTNISASCSILVDSKVLVSGITVNPTSVSMFVADKEQLTASVYPANATAPDVTWSSSNSNIATVSTTGLVTAIAIGNATITVTSVDDPTQKAVCQISVQSEELKINPTSKTLSIGDSFAIGYTVTPPVKPTFISSDSGIATVDADGTVTAIAEGKTNITVSAHGFTAVCVVTVANSSIAFLYDTKVMYDSEEILIPYSVLVPSTAVPLATSSSSGVVEIMEATSSGVKVRALTPGSSTITATFAGMSTTCVIQVQQLRVVFFGTAPLKFYQGFSDPVGYTIYPEHARSLSVSLSSSNTANLVYVSGNIFQGVEANTTATISATFDAFPTKVFTVQAQIKPAITIAETQIDLVANSGISSVNNNLYSNIYVSYPLTIDKHPRATVAWSGTMVGSSFQQVNITAAGVLSTMHGTSVNGSTPVIGTINNADNGVTYTDQLTVDVYDAVRVWLNYWEESGISLPNNETEVTGYAAAYCDKNIGHFVGSYQFSATSAMNVNAYDQLPGRVFVTSFVESVTYPLVAGQVYYLEINEGDRRDKGNGNNMPRDYRYYYSAPSFK